MKHIKKTYTKFNGGYVLENIETFNNATDPYRIMIGNDSYTRFDKGYIVTVFRGNPTGSKMTKNIFLT